MQRRLSIFRPWLFPGFVLILFAGLAGRLLSYPVNRDEHLFITVAQQLPQGDLYRDLGYNHLPNLPYLLSLIYRLSGIEHFLLTGRLVVLASWAIAFLAIWLIGRRLALSPLMTATAIALLACNNILIGPPGMLATNSHLPMSFALLSFAFLLGAVCPKSLRAGWLQAFASGLCVSIAIGFKANFVFLAPCVAGAALLAPAATSLADRLTRQFLPLCLGGLIGGLPSILAFLADPEGMWAHTVRYFTELHSAYWDHSLEPKVMSLQGKILLAERLWLSGASLLLLVGICAWIFLPLPSRGWRGLAGRLVSFPALPCLVMAGFGMVVAFVPTPSFSQYFVPPIPFLILAFMALAPKGDESADSVVPLLLALLALALIGASTRLVPGLVGLARPGAWPGLAVNRTMHSIFADQGLPPGARVATMSPIFALEGGGSIYPEFAAGQFVYRVADYIGEDDRRFFRTTSPRELNDFLNAGPPDAILVDPEEPIEEVLGRYAREHGFREVPIAARPGSPALTLFVRQAPKDRKSETRRLNQKG